VHQPAGVGVELSDPPLTSHFASDIVGEVYVVVAPRHRCLCCSPSPPRLASSGWVQLIFTRWAGF
jgi:hypothetical protein